MKNAKVEKIIDYIFIEKSFINKKQFKHKIQINIDYLDLYSRLHLIHLHQHSLPNFLYIHIQINCSDELRVPFNIASQWCMS